MPTIPLRSFRLVCERNRFPEVEALLEAEGFRFEPEPFSPWCRRLLCEPLPLGNSLAAFFGYIYIQDRASMLPPLALAPAEGSSVLDIAASPGSKSGFLAQLTGKDGFVLANEPNAARLATLRMNMNAANLLQVATTSYPGERLPLGRGSWKYILLDPPCSGWGTVRKNPRAPQIWRGSKINKLIALQRTLLRTAAMFLAHGGRILYSTCTTNSAENEEQTEFAIRELGLEPVPIATFPGFRYCASRAGALLVNGEESQSQGFYLSLMQKSGNFQAEEFQSSDFPEIPRLALESPVCNPELLPRGRITVFNQKVRFLPSTALSLLPSTMRWQGATLGKMTDGFLPDCRLRALLPEPADKPEKPVIIMEEVDAIKKLLGGEKMETRLKFSCAALWWRGLPLGSCRIKNGRVISGFRLR